MTGNRKNNGRNNTPNCHCVPIPNSQSLRQPLMRTRNQRTQQIYDSSALLNPNSHRTRGMGVRTSGSGTSRSMPQATRRSNSLGDPVLRRDDACPGGPGGGQDRRGAPSVPSAAVAFYIAVHQGIFAAGASIRTNFAQQRRGHPQLRRDP